MALVVDVEVVAFEEVVLYFFDEDDEVTGGAAADGGVAFACFGEFHVLGEAGGEVEGKGFFCFASSFSLAVVAGGGDDFALAFALVADLGGKHLDEYVLLYGAFLSAACAGVAYLDGGAVLGAVAVAGGAGGVVFDFDFFLGALDGFVEGDFDFEVDVEVFGWGGVVDGEEVFEAGGVEGEHVFDVA